jgi:cysteine desulfurase
MKRIYLDYAATTPTDPEVVDAMLPYFATLFGNPSSLHAFGQEAKAAVEEARAQVAALLHAAPEEIIFTSSGTESNNWALKGVAYAHESTGKHIITSAIEHHAILEPCKFLADHGFTISYLPVDRYGLVDPAVVQDAIRDDTILISVMHANNDVGTIEPIAEIGQIARERGILFHTDAVQTVGHLPLDVGANNIDLLSLSAHKLYGPKGIGGLYIRKGVNLTPLLHGGEQQWKRRAATENVPGIVGFGKAAALAQQRMADEAVKLTALRDQFMAKLFDTIDGITLNGHPTKRLPNHVNISVASVEGESVLLNLDLAGIAASAGSACSASRAEPSHVLAALGVHRELAYSALRFTLGRATQADELDRAVAALAEIVGNLRVLTLLAKGRL